MCHSGAVMHWCFDCTNKCHSNYFTYMPPIGHMDWVGLGHRVDGLDWIDLENWTHVQLRLVFTAASFRFSSQRFRVSSFPLCDGLPQRGSYSTIPNISVFRNRPVSLSVTFGSCDQTINEVFSMCYVDNKNCIK